MARRWLTLVGVVMLIAVAAAAFVDYEMIRKDADAARFDAAGARAGCLYGTAAFSIAERKRRHARSGPRCSIWLRTGGMNSSTPQEGQLPSAARVVTAAFWANSRKLIP
jgi:hypothetical protein